MSKKVLISVVVLEVVVLFLLSALIIHPYLPQDNEDNIMFPPAEGNPIKITLENLYSDKIENYDGKIKNVGATPTEEVAKQKALEIWAEVFKGETIDEASLRVEYFAEEECFVVSADDGTSGKFKVNPNGGGDLFIPPKYYHAIITKSGEVLAVY